LPDIEPGTHSEVEAEAAREGLGGVAPLPAAEPAPARPQDAAIAAHEAVTSSRGQLRIVTSRFFRHKLALTGLVIFLILLLGSVIIPRLWKYKYATITNQFATGPSAAHPFGTDLIGHDMFAQVLSGTLTSIETGLLVAGISTVIGTLVGALAGYYGGAVDQVLMRLTDLVLVFPVLAILLVLSNKFSKQSDSQLFVGLLLALVFWTYLARLIRGTFMSLREREFIEAEHAIGASTWRIILIHMVPNAACRDIVRETIADFCA
jgi:peptide/nickel transport system permease protein